MNTQNTVSMKNKKQRGATMIEVIVYTAMVALVLAGIAWGVNKAFASNDVKDEMTAVTNIMGALPDVRSAAGYGTASLAPALIAQNAIPSTWSIGGTPAAPTITNAFNGAVVITGATTRATISMANVPQEACNKLAVRTSKGQNFQTTQINANTAITGEVTPAIAQAQCVDTNTIVWTSRN